MTKSHLLFWVFKFLFDRHPAVMEDLIKNFYEEKWAPIEGAWTIKETFLERLRAYEQVKGK